MITIWKLNQFNHLYTHEIIRFIVTSIQGDIITVLHKVLVTSPVTITYQAILCSEVQKFCCQFFSISKQDLPRHADIIRESL